MTTTLAVHEQQRLQSLEATIRQGLKQFYAVGAALLEIRESRLYRATHATFADYCRDRWDMEDRRANQIIEAASVRKNFTETLPPPPVESQARELAKLPPDQQADAYREAVAEADGKPTAKDIRAVANRRLGKPEPGVPIRNVDTGYYTPAEWAATKGGRELHNLERPRTPSVEELASRQANARATEPEPDADDWDAQQDRAARQAEEREAAEAEAARKGKTKVNGVVVEAEPKHIAKLREAGRITGDVEITEPTSGVAVAEAEPEPEPEPAPEPAEDEDAWLAGLPLSSKLTGRPLQKFRNDARRFFRRRAVVRAAREQLRRIDREVGRMAKAAREADDSKVAYLDSIWLRMPDPRDWFVCMPVDKGGCGGEGHVPLIAGTCATCHGRGYFFHS